MNPILSLPTEREALKYRRPVPRSLLGFPPVAPPGPAALSSCIWNVVASDLRQTVADGGLVDRWTDRIGGYHLTQTTAATRPLFVTNHSDRLPCVCFDHYRASGQANRLLQHTTFPAQNKRALSLFWVGDLNSLDRTGYLINLGSIDVTLIQIGGVLQVFSGSGKSTTHRLPSARRVAIVVTCGPSAVRVYVDRVDNVQSLSANSAGFGGAGLALSNSGGNLYGRVYESAVFRSELTRSEVGQLLEYARQTYETGSAVQSPVGHVVIDGDSTSEGIGVTRNRPWPVVMDINSSWQAHNHAISGQTLAQMIADQSEPNAWADATNWLFVYGGHNDLAANDAGATIEGRLNTYCSAAITAGFDKSRIVTFTLANSGLGLGGTARDDCNTLIRANYTGYAGWLIDEAADSALGVTPGAGFLDSTNYVDGVHKNDKGVRREVELIRSTIGSSLPF